MGTTSLAWLALLCGCGVDSIRPDYVDAPPRPPPPGGVSSESLRALFLMTGITSSGETPPETELSAEIYDVSVNAVSGALVEARLPDGTTVTLPETDTGYYEAVVPGWQPTVRLDVHRGADYIEALTLEANPPHTVTVEPDSLALGAPIHLGWEPNHGENVFVDLYVLLGEDLTFVDQGVGDVGDYESTEIAFPAAGAYQLFVDRYRVLRVNSQDSIAFVDIYVIQDLEVAAPIDAAVPDAGPDGPLDAP